ARWVVGAFRAGGVDLVQANSDGSVGNQTVFHLHVHVLPRYHDDRLGAWWSPERAAPPGITEAAPPPAASGAGGPREPPAPPETPGAPRPWAAEGRPAPGPPPPLASTAT